MGNSHTAQVGLQGWRPPQRAALPAQHMAAPSFAESCPPCWQLLLADASPGTGRGVTVYVVDSGLRLTHQEFRTLDGTRSRASHGEGNAGRRSGRADCVHQLKETQNPPR